MLRLNTPLHMLQAELNPAGPSRKLEVPLKITIGTIPLRSLFPEYNEAARRAGHTTGPTLPQLPSAPPEGTASNYPPPDARELHITSQCIFYVITSFIVT